MKGQPVGENTQTLLWPDSASMTILRSLSRPYNNLLALDPSAPDLLWPAQLINEQARLRKHKDYSRPLAIIALVTSILLCIVVGPMQLILAALFSDYSWVTGTYYPSALKCVLLAASLVSILNLAALILAWKSQPKPTRTTVALVSGSILSIGAIWLSGCVTTWPPHILTVILLIIALASVFSALFINKQYITKIQNGTPMKVTLSLLMSCCVLEMLLGPIYFIENADHTDPAQLKHLAAAQADARQPGIPEMLSNMTFAICNGKYQTVYMSKAYESGLFECNDSGEVYSVTDIQQQNTNSVRGQATYLGTTKDNTISLAFPSAFYLYRTLPQVTNEDELVLMVGASTERELIDSLVPQLVSYWQNNHSRNLHLSVFYNINMSSVTSVKDYVLMAALDTMVMVEKLPHSNTIRSYLNGEMLSYIFQPDKSLFALNELGSDPSLYSANSRDSFTLQRHISCHLQAEQPLTEDTARELLQTSFVNGAQNP